MRSGRREVAKRVVLECEGIVRDYGRWGHCLCSHVASFSANCGLSWRSWEVIKLNFALCVVLFYHLPCAVGS